MISLRRKRRKRPKPRSDLKAGTGRFFSPSAPWNNPVSVERAVRNERLTVAFAALGHIDVRVGPDIWHVTDNALNGTLWDRETKEFTDARLPVEWQRQGLISSEFVLVDHHARLVTSGRNLGDQDSLWWADDIEQVDLDSDGWGSAAVGLVLERELLSRQIDHAVGIWAPAEFYGAWVLLTGPGTRDQLTGRLAGALQTYGGIVVGISDEPCIRVEQSRSATFGDPIGRTYRGIGMGADPWPLVLPLDECEIRT